MSGRIRKAVGRLRLSPPRTTSVCAKVAITPARCPRPIQSLRPSSTHPEPSAFGTAVVFRFCTSLPVSGSVSA